MNLNFTLMPTYVDVQVQGNDPSCLREFLLQILDKNSSSGNVGLQVCIHLVVNVVSSFSSPFS